MTFCRLNSDFLSESFVLGFFFSGENTLYLVEAVVGLPWKITVNKGLMHV